MYFNPIVETSLGVNDVAPDVYPTMSRAQKPTDQEVKARTASYFAKQHENDGDNRNRAERDSEGKRQDVSIN